MSKKRINEWIPKAKEALENDEIKIAENGKINKTYRGQISSFGAAVTMGSLQAAVAFFSEKSADSDGVDRTKLIQAMYYCITGEVKNVKEILKDVCRAENKSELKNQFTDASVALKLAMNFFELK